MSNYTMIFLTNKKPKKMLPPFGLRQQPAYQTHDSKERHPDYTPSWCFRQDTTRTKRKEGITMKRITMMAARLFANMTEEEACAAMKIEPRQLKSWEHGRSVPSLEYALLMAETYGLSIDVISFDKAYNSNRKTDDTLAVALKLIENFNDDEIDILRNVMCNSKRPAALAQI